MKPIITFVAGFAAGWIARSVSDTPEGVGVKLLEVAQSARDRLVHWVAQERERLEDMMAEARAGAEARTGAAPESSNGRPVSQRMAGDEA